MQWIKFIQIAIALMLIIIILLQNRGTGLSGIFGGSGNVYLAKRGADKILFITTIILSALFLLISLTSVVL